MHIGIFMKKSRSYVCLCGLCAEAWVSGNHSEYLRLVKNCFFVCYHLTDFMDTGLIDFQGKMSGVPIPQAEVLKVGVPNPHPAVRKLSSHCEKM